MPLVIPPWWPGGDPAVDPFSEHGRMREPSRALPVTPEYSANLVRGGCLAANSSRNLVRDADNAPDLVLGRLRRRLSPQRFQGTLRSGWYGTKELRADAPMADTISGSGPVPLPHPGRPGRHRWPGDRVRP
jgi:hypothetical protein